jgi:hypothetical protein
MKKTLVLSLFILAIFVTGCKKKDSDEKLAPGVHKVTVLETIPVSSYTYARVNDNDKEVWTAFSKREVKVGAVLYFSKYMELENFSSKELNKTFPKILFVDDISEQPAGQQPAPTAQGNAMQQQPQKPVIEKQVIKVAKAAGGITIAQLYEGLKSYDGKTVKIAGKVVKYNEGIMNRNWVHIQDGTGNNDSFDLTVTTNEQVRVNDVVTFEGKISLNKDFGYGYSYKVLLEDAKKSK